MKKSEDEIMTPIPSML